VTTAQANPGISFEEAQAMYATIRRERALARESGRKFLGVKAQKKHDHAKAFALKFAEYRSEGKPVEESKILAKADVAHIELDQDLADADARAAEKRWEELKDSRATVRAMADWTREES
jgi:hypothetical protein